MKKLYKTIISIALMTIVAACTQSPQEPTPPPPTPTPDTSIPLTVVFESNRGSILLPESIKVGAWMSFTETPNETIENAPYAIGNPYWTTPTTIKFKSNSDYAQMMAVAPYNKDDTKTSIVRSVSTNQTAQTIIDEQFWMTERTGISPSKQGAVVYLNPIYEIVEINLIKAYAIDDKWWESAEKKVEITAYTTCKSSIVETEKILTEKMKITCVQNDNIFTALVPPQMFEANVDLFTITVGGETITSSLSSAMHSTELGALKIIFDANKERDKIFKPNFVSNSHYQIQPDATAGIWINFAQGSRSYENIPYSHAIPYWCSSTNVNFTSASDIAEVTAVVPYERSDAKDKISRTVSNRQSEYTIAREQLWIGRQPQIPYSQSPTEIKLDSYCDIINVTLKKPSGIADAWWNTVPKSIEILAYRSQTIGMANSNRQLDDKQQIKFYNDGNDFSAIIPSQAFDASTQIFSITVGGETITESLGYEISSADMSEIEMTYTPTHRPIQLNFTSSDPKTPIPQSKSIGAWVDFLSNAIEYKNIEYYYQKPYWTTDNDPSYISSLDRAKITAVAPYVATDIKTNISRRVSTAQTSQTIAAEQFWVGAISAVPYSTQTAQISLTPSFDVVRITLEKGNGITDAWWRSVQKSVKIKAFTAQNMNIATNAKNISDNQMITMGKSNNQFSAILPAQSFSADEQYFEVTIGEKKYYPTFGTKTSSSAMDDLIFTVDNEEITITSDGDINDFEEEPIT